MGLVYFKTCLGKAGPPDLNHQLTIGSCQGLNILQISLNLTNKMAQNLNWRSAFAKMHLNERSVGKLSNISFHFERRHEKQKQCQKTYHDYHPTPRTATSPQHLHLRSNHCPQVKFLELTWKLLILTKGLRIDTTRTHTCIYIYIYMVNENYHPIILPKNRYFLFYNIVKVYHDKFHSTSWLVDYNL